MVSIAADWLLPDDYLSGFFRDVPGNGPLFGNIYASSLASASSPSGNSQANAEHGRQQDQPTRARRTALSHRAWNAP